jgi:hypothetical protein
MQFANETPVQGRTAVREVMAGFWATVAGMHHAFTNVFEDGDQTLIEADVTYTRLDGSTVLIKTGTVIRRRSGLVADQHVYVDLAPLGSGRLDSADI